MVKDGKRRMGRIQLSQELVMKMFDFDGGTILTAQWGIPGDAPYGSPPVLEIYIEHPDMPEVDEMRRIQIVTPDYQRTARIAEQTERVRPSPPTAGGLRTEEEWRDAVNSARTSRQHSKGD